MKITAISGSLRKDSYNTYLLRAIQNYGRHLELDVSIKILNEIPLFSEDLESEDIPAVVNELSDNIKKSDAVIIATPEYNGISPGALINTLDWLSLSSLGKPLNNKTVGIVGATTGGLGTARAQIFLQSLAVTLGMHPFSKPQLRISHVDQKFSKNGDLVDDHLEVQIQEYLIGFKDRVNYFKS